MVRYVIRVEGVGDQQRVLVKCSAAGKRSQWVVKEGVPEKLVIAAIAEAVAKAEEHLAAG